MENKNDRIFKKILITGTEIHIYIYINKKRHEREIFGEFERRKEKKLLFIPSAFLDRHLMNSYLIIMELFCFYHNKNLMLVV